MAEEVRKITTILFADISGYTALMQQDEQKAISTVSSFRSELEKQVPSFDGKIVQYFGDGCLLSFDSSSSAINCAIDLQKYFIYKEIPVRMGLHLGEVVFRDNNAFGDGVNIASRVESISIPGAILLSKSVRDLVRNKPEFSFKDLGEFQFKNVAEPLQVYAVANEGIQVPGGKSLTGKLADTPKKKSPAFLIGIGTMLVLAILSFFAYQGAFQSTPESSSFPINEELKKRIAVMVFENQTADPKLASFGTMTSDWITRGLMETGEANVVNAANLQQKINTLDTNSGANPGLTEATGIEIALRGRYYLDGESLIVQSNIVNVSSGEVIYAIKPMEGHRDSARTILRKLTEEVLSYWAVQEQSRFLQNPPKYEAYQEYLAYPPLIVSDPVKAASHLKKAYELDPTFFAPVFPLYSIENQLGNKAGMDSLFTFLTANRSKFTKWERIRFEELQAMKDRNWLTLGQLAQQRYDMDNSDLGAISNAISAFNWAHHPQKSLDIIKDFDLRFLADKNKELSWTSTNQVYPNFILGNYEKVDEIARDYTLPKFPDALAVMHLMSLAELDRQEEMATFFQKYKEKKVFNTVGRPTPTYETTIILCCYLACMKDPSYLPIYVSELENMLSEEAGLPASSRIKGFIHFFKGEIEQAAKEWEREEVRKEDWPPWLWLIQKMDRHSRLGHCYNLLGEKEKAEEYLQKILAETSEHPSFTGAKPYYSTRVFSALTDKEKAIQSLQDAVEEGASFFGPVRYTTDPFLKPLHGNPVYEKLVKPKS
ncbi:MAG: adenylate/guanylate cyclase domain-containing protein [Bacteroidota bacterium]